MFKFILASRVAKALKKKKKKEDEEEGKNSQTKLYYRLPVSVQISHATHTRHVLWSFKNINLGFNHSIYYTFIAFRIHLVLDGCWNFKFAQQTIQTNERKSITIENRKLKRNKNWLRTMNRYFAMRNAPILNYNHQQMAFAVFLADVLTLFCGQGEGI